MRRPRVQFLVKQLALGGAEQTIVTVARALRDEWDVRVGFCFGSDAHREQLERAGIPVDQLSTSGSPAVVLGRLRHHLAAFRPDVLNAHDAFSAILARVAAPAGVAVVTTNQNVETVYRRKVAAVDRLTSVARGAGTISISQEVQRTWLEGPLSALLRRRPARAVIPNPVDLDRIDDACARDRGATRAELGIPDDAELIVNVGRFVEQKGQRHLVDAFARVLDARPRAWLALVGYGPLEGRLRARADALGVASRTTFAIHRHDAPRILAAGDVFAFPSLWEGLGVAVLEAMAAGLPVIATDRPPLTEVVDHGRTGLLTPVADADALAGALIGLLGDGGRAALLAAAGRAAVRQRYAPERVACEYDAFFRTRIGTERRA